MRPKWIQHSGSTPLVFCCDCAELDEGLKVDAMADLRQAALFTPWALLQVLSVALPTGAECGTANKKNRY